MTYNSMRELELNERVTLVWGTRNMKEATFRGLSNREGRTLGVFKVEGASEDIYIPDSDLRSKILTIQTR